MWRTAEINGGSYDTYVYGRRSQQSTNLNVPMHGIAVGGPLALHESPVRIVDADETIDPSSIGNPDGKCPVSRLPGRVY